MSFGDLNFTDEIKNNDENNDILPLAWVKPEQYNQTRAIAEIPTIRKNIYDYVINSFSALPPLVNKQYKIVFSDLKYVDPETYTNDQVKKAILEGQTLARRLRGTVNLIDTQTNKIVDKKKTTLAHVPYLHNDGTFIINGNAYTLSHQSRLRPGVYHRIKDNGEIEAHVNAMPGKGFSHRYFLEPQTGLFKLSIGQSRLPAIQLLKILGASDNEIRQAIGDQLFKINMEKTDPLLVNKLYEKVAKKSTPAASQEEKEAAIREAFQKIELDPKVTQFILGKPYTHFNKEIVLKSLNRLLRLSRLEDEPDDRDNLSFKLIFGPEDLIAERVFKAHAAMRAALWKATNVKNLSYWPTGIASKEIINLMFDSGLGQTPEQTNPIHILDKNYRISQLGYGGIPSLDAVTEETRDIQPSHLNFIDLVVAPESANIGVDMRLAYLTKKSGDGKLYSLFLNPKTKKTEWRSSQDLINEVVALPGELDNNSPLVAAIHRGRLKYLPKNAVTLIPVNFEHSYSILTNLVPLKSTIKGHRLSMGARFLSQALPLTEPEAPLVQSALPDQPDKSFDEFYGNYVGNIYAENKPGKVVNVTDKEIVVKYDDGDKKSYSVYNHFPFNRQTYIHNQVLVNPGDKISPGQLLARSNYSDAAGRVALGKNLRTAYIPFKGMNYEDAYVISESAAKKLSSEHMYQNILEFSDDIKKNKKNYISLFPSHFTLEQLKNVDDDGVVKPGTVLNYGDPIILAAKALPLSYKKAYSPHGGSYEDIALKWEYHTPGIVVDVSKTNKWYIVTTKTSSPLQEGDKIAGRYGDKGIVSLIVPDDEMPRDENGQPFEVLASPHGIISRTNPAQVLEAILGKIAYQNGGKAYKLKNWQEIKDWVEFVENEARKNNIKYSETVIDPQTGKKIPEVLTGVRYFMKLHHLAEKKDQGRGIGGYTSEDTPAKGGEHGSKKLALMDVNALLSHGATEVLRDAKLVRGQKNSEYWSLFMRGFNPPSPKAPLVYEKFLNQLKASGANIIRNPNSLQIMALTDKDIDLLAENRNLKNSETIKWDASMKPITGGLFDESLTGGHDGNRWSAIVLAEPMPNPIMEEPIRRILNLTEDKFRAILSGKEALNGFTGPKAIQKALENINLEAEINKAREDIKSGKRSLRDNAVRRLGFLQAAVKNNIHPKEWIWTRVPVIPPIFRPLSLIEQSGVQIIADANYLYKDLWNFNENLKNLKNKVEDLSSERLAVYDSIKAVTGLTDPVSVKTRSKNVKGFLQHIFGSSPKYGTVQQKLLGSTVDLVGRAVVSPDANLSMDEIGLPENRAWEVYYPFIIRRLVRRGINPLQAAEYVEAKTDVAKQALLEELKERPVLVNRAPVLHRYGLLAFWPKLVPGDVLKVSPTVVGGFNMDFDGDTSNYHVPVTEEARLEAIAKMLPSRNLFNVSRFQAHYLPRQEYIAGLYIATTANNAKKQPRTFATERDAAHAFFRGELDVDQPVVILNHPNYMGYSKK
jgi:DNA-directed RNA polymerase subunit beta